MTRLEANGLTLAYGDSTIVVDLTAQIPDGMVTSIIGPNGCGKSTLLRALARLMKPKHGTVVLDGEAIHRQPTKMVARRLGLLPQGSAAPEAVTVEDLVGRGRFPHQSFFSPPTNADRDAINRALELAGIVDLRKRSIDELSGGQRQRAWIAMVLAQDTPLLLLDEPTTYLDIAHQNEVLELVQQLNHDEGKTVVMVLHDVNEAARASGHLIAMRDGAILAAGEPSEIVTPDRLREVFGIESTIVRHPRTGQPVCVPHGEEEGPSSPASSPEGARIRAEHLELAYGKRTVAKDISVAFPEGKISAIIGPNACGKTTLLRAIARQLGPRAGTAFLGEAPVAAGSRRNFASRLAFLTQMPVTPSGVSVEDLVASGRLPYQRWWRQWSTADASAIDDAIDATGLWPFRHQAVETLSGGQRQRAWIAMTLAQDAPVLVLDEPTTFLDIAHQVEVLDLVKRLNRQRGRTVLMVLHDLHQACRYADFLVAMKDGQVVTAGSPNDVMTAPLIQEVFSISCDVATDPRSHTPIVLPIPRERKPLFVPEPAREVAPMLVGATAGGG